MSAFDAAWLDGLPPPKRTMRVLDYDYWMGEFNRQTHIDIRASLGVPRHVFDPRIPYVAPRDLDGGGDRAETERT